MQFVEDRAKRKLSTLPKIGSAFPPATASQCDTIPAYAFAPSHVMVSTDPSRRLTVISLSRGTRYMFAWNVG